MLHDLAPVHLIERTLDIENVRLNLINVNITESTDHKLLTLTHTHIFTEIFVCISGEITLHCTSGDITLYEGDIALFPPGNLHTMDGAETTQKSEKYSVGITVKKTQNDYSVNLFDRFSEVIYKRGVSVYKNLSDITEMLKKICTNDGHDQLLLMPHLLNTLFHTEREIFSQKQQSKSIASDDTERLVLIEEIINSCFLSEISAQDIAQMLFISRRHLDRIISSHYKKSLRAMIVEKRIVYAAELLRNTDRTVEEISRLSSFPSLKSFTSEFTKKYGITPVQYRKIKLTDMEKK
jgi:AraC-like DNA-binding protein/mannose-6-phosphate isomerase-like protein (cupin superfamily)